MTDTESGTDAEFDIALVTAAFRLAGERGWRNINVAMAAREAGLSLSEARARFPFKTAILMRFGRLADQAALTDAVADGAVRDQLFDLLMRRFDFLQAHRAGVKSLLRSLPMDPPMAMLLACATRRSMRWMLQAAGVPATGPRGELQVKGLVAVWLWAVRAWERDESDDLSGTMAAVDNALQRAERVASWLEGDHRAHSDTTPPPAEPPSAPTEPAAAAQTSVPPPSAGSAGAGELDPSDPIEEPPPPPEVDEA